uniref:Uncharacterized protein n=1 Tax=Romanomermis culicivorax TaxID=13658 RepID=A0A915HMV1_ROMCU
MWKTTKFVGGSHVENTFEEKTRDEDNYRLRRNSKPKRCVLVDLKGSKYQNFPAPCAGHGISEQPIKIRMMKCNLFPIPAQSAGKIFGLTLENINLSNGYL